MKIKLIWAQIGGLLIGFTTLPLKLNRFLMCLEDIHVRMHQSISYVVLKHPLWYVKFPLSYVGQNDHCMYYTCDAFV